MLHWKNLVQLSDEDLARYDIARVNLACARDLPDAGDLDEERCSDKLADWAMSVRKFTEAGMKRFWRKPSEFNNSEGYYRTLCMVTHLQRDQGLRYNEQKIPDHVPLETPDSFVHGALFGKGGTCGSLAVVYVAVGRQLGYPLKLVAAKRGAYGHLFPRWDDPNGERFNIEATNKGLNCYPDDYYRTGIFAVERDIEERGCLLKSMGPREELAHFLAERGQHWLAFGRWRRAVEAFAWATAIAPHHGFYDNTLKKVLNEWLYELERRKPPCFPRIYIGFTQRRFPATLPLEIEKEILGREVTENLLNNPSHETDWWGPLRCGVAVRSPSKVLVDFEPDGSCRVGVYFGDM